MLTWIRVLFSRRWWWATLLVLLGMGVMIRLSIWQFNRLDERRAANVELRAALEADPQPVTPDLQNVDPETLQDRLMVANGRFDFAEQVVLLVQNWQGRAGVHLVAPLVLADGETAVLVDRGWIPDAENSVNGRAQFNQPGDLTLEGYVAQSQTLSRAADTVPDTPQQNWYRVDIAAIQPQMPYDLLPFYIIQAPPEEVVQELPYRVAPTFDLSEGPHLNYAIQWIIFTVILGGGYLYYVRRHDSQLTDA